MPTTEAHLAVNAAAADRLGANSEPLDSSFESWGRYPKYKAHVVPMHWQQDFPANIAGLHNGVLPVGMGRSYGDCCLLKDGNLLLTTPMNRLLGFDPTTGILTAEAGITLAQILDFAVPRGFFLPVTPGTKYVTLGGAIANDIHGKNHHVAGTIGNHLTQFELVRSDGSGASARLPPIRTGSRPRSAASDSPDSSPGPRCACAPSSAATSITRASSITGSMSFSPWPRSTSTPSTPSAGSTAPPTAKTSPAAVYMVGDHSQESGDLTPSPEPKLSFPIEAPASRSITCRSRSLIVSSSISR